MSNETKNKHNHIVESNEMVKQKTTVDWLQSIELERDLTLADWKKAKEMERDRMIDFARNYMLYIHKEGIITIETFYSETYGGNK
jgi:hypothetical protein